MTIRKTLTQIIAIIMVAVTLFGAVPFTVFANTAENEGEQTMSIIVSSETAMPGETIEVTISVENNPGIASLKFDVEYDDTVLTLTDVVFNEAFGSMVTTPEPYVNPQPITMISPLKDNKANGVFATLTFAVNENTPDGYVAEVNIAYSPSDIFNTNDEAVLLTTVNGKVSVFRGIPGDIDGNKTVNTKDAIALFRHVAGWTVDHDPDALDVNGDGKVDTKDAIQLFRYVAGWDVELNYGSVEHRHEFEITDHKEATCTEDGNITYFYCTSCEKYFDDITASNEIKLSDTVIEASGHTIKYTAVKAPTCTDDGNIEYWECSTCETYFADANGEEIINSESIIVGSLGHALTKVSEKASTCTDDGNITYWHCENCENNYIDELAFTKINVNDTVVSASGHALQHVEARSATCTEDGNIEYWYCSACESAFADEEAINALETKDIVVSATGHGDNLKHVAAVDATVDASGNVEYWKCDKCGKYYEDIDAQNEITAESTIIPILLSYTINFVDSKNWPGGNKIKFAQSEDLLLTTFFPPSVVGYEFKGWYTEDGTHKKAIAAGNTANYILYADWKTIKYTITYVNAPVHSNPDEYDIEQEIILNKPSWEGLIFSHWTDENDNIVTKIEKGNTSSRKFEAHWISPQNYVKNSTNKQPIVIVKPDNNSQELYYLVYEVGTVYNVLLDKIYDTYKYNGMEYYSEEHEKVLSVGESTANSVSHITTSSFVRSESYTNAVTEFTERSKSKNQSFTLCPEVEVEGVKVKLFEYENGRQSMDTNSLTEYNSTDEGSAFGFDSTDEISSTVSYYYDVTSSVKRTLTLSPDISPAGSYTLAWAGDFRVYAIVVFNPITENYGVSIYSVSLRTYSTTFYEVIPEYNLDVDISVCDTINYDIPVEDLDKNIIDASFYVEYGANGGNGPKMPLSMCNYDGSMTLLNNTYSKPGYKFDGWKLTNGSSVTIYNDGATITKPDIEGNTVHLEAIWSPITYTVQYNGNGATSGSTASSTHVYDTAKPLTANGFTRTGYTFLGWSENKNANTATYGNKASVENMRNTNGAVVPLYAIWKANTYTVTLNANGGTCQDNIKVLYNDYYSSLPTPIRDEHIFLGWYNESICITNTTKVTTSQNHTLIAKWLRISSTVTLGNGQQDRHAIRLWSSWGHNDDWSGSDLINPNMSRDDLIRLGYSKISVSMTFHYRVDDWGDQLIKISSIENQEVTRFEYEWDETGWTSHTVDYELSLTQVGTNCEYNILWYLFRDGNNSDTWFVGGTSLIITAS